jgi:hypothetical protein
MPSTKNWWAGEIDWSTPAGQLLQRFLTALPKDRPFHLTLYGSAPLQLTVDRQLMSGDVDLSIARLLSESGGTEPHASNHANQQTD